MIKMTQKTTIAERMVKIETKVENIEKTNESQTKCLEGIGKQNKQILQELYGLSEWRANKDLTDSRQDKDLHELWKNKASQKSVDYINNSIFWFTVTVLGSVITAIVTKIVGFW